MDLREHTALRLNISAIRETNGNLYVTILDWPGKDLILPIDISGSNITISMLGRQGNFKYIKENGKVRIDLSEIYFNDLPGLYAWTFKIEGMIL